MHRVIFATLAAVTLAIPTHGAAQGNFLVPIIEDCNAEANAATLPDCLKIGAIAYNMLQLVRTDAFYAQAAMPVIEVCKARNDIFKTEWLMLRKALEARPPFPGRTYPKGSATDLPSAL